MIPATIFFLFYFDSRGSLKDLVWSVIRSLKMIWFGLPFFFILIWGMWILYFLFGFMFRSITSSLGFHGLLIQFLIIFAVVPASFAANYYTKRLHDQYKEYFN